MHSYLQALYDIRNTYLEIGLIGAKGITRHGVGIQVDQSEVQSVELASSS